MTISMSKQRPNIGSILTKLLLAYLIITFILFPIISMFGIVFVKDGHLSFSAVRRVFSSPKAMRSIKNSLLLALTMIVTVNLSGTLAVLIMDYWDIKGSKMLRLAYMTPLIYGQITLAMGYKFVYGKAGFVTNLLLKIFPNWNPNWFMGYGAVAFLMTFACTQNHLMFLSSAIKNIDGNIIEAGRSMGASGAKIFFKIVLPILKPSYFAITVLTFLTGMSALSAPLVLGGDNFQTINPMIVMFAQSPRSRDISAFLAVLLGCTTIILMTILNQLEKHGTYMSLSKTKTKLQKQKIQNPVSAVIINAFAWIMFVIYVLPIFCVVLFSFTNGLAVKTGVLAKGCFTLQNYKNLFTKMSAFKPYLVSICYSLAAAVIVSLISIIVARIVIKGKSRFKALWEYSVLIPWLLPSTLIALSLMLSFDVRRILVGNRVLVGTAVLLLIGYVIVKLPFSFRMIRAAFFGINDDMEEAAKTMGAGQVRIMAQIIIPYIMPVVSSVIVLNFNNLLSDYDMSVFLYSPRLKPLGIIIKDATDQTATVDAVAMGLVYSVVLMAISAFAIWFSRRDPSARRKKKIATAVQQN